MTEEPEKPSLDIKLTRQALPDDVQQNRERFETENKLLEPIVQPRIEAQLQACRLAVEQLEEWHREIADTTDLDLAGHSRGSAMWLLAGRSLGLTEALIVLAEGGIDTVSMVIGRALHEANHMLLAFGYPEAEDVVRQWLEDEGKFGYVKPKASRDAQEQFEEKMDEVMEGLGLPSLGRTGPLVEEMYDRMSRVAHNRRSTCLSDLEEALRSYTYGRHDSPIRRGVVVEWTASMTQEVISAAGDTFRAFFGAGFFAEHVQPIYLSVDAVRKTCPLDRESILAAANA